jgi:hypothetical protein
MYTRTRSTTRRAVLKKELLKNHHFYNFITDI